MISGKFIKTRVGRGATALAFLLTLFGANLAPLTSFAAVDSCVWSGATSGTWSDATNWSSCSGTAPDNGDTLIFPASPTTSVMNNDIVGLSAVSTIFNGDGYTLNGNALNTGDIQFVGTGNTVNTDLTLSGAAPVNGKGVGSNTISGDITYANTGDLTWSGAGTLTLSGGQSGAIPGDEALPAGTLTVTGADTHTIGGDFTLSGGTLDCEIGSCLGDAANTVVQSGVGQLVLDGVTVPNDLTLNAGTSVSATGGANTLSGDVTVAGVTTNSIAGGSTLTLTGGLAVNAGLTLSGAGLGSTWNYNGGGVTGASSITCSTADCMFTAGSPAYSGNIEALSGSLLEPVAATSLGNTVGTTTVDSGATLNLGAGAATYLEPLVISGVGIGGSLNGAIVSNGSGAQALNGGITLAGASTISKQSVPTLTIGGAIIGSGDLTFLGNGNGGMVDVTGGTANNYAGNTVVNSSVVELAKTAGLAAISGDLTVNAGEVDTLAGEQIPDTSTVALNNNGGMAELSIGNNDTETIATLMGDGTTSLGNGSSALVFTSGTYSGSPTGAGAFTKTGTGTATVTGTSAHTGSTNVLNGVFIVNGNYSSAPLNLQGGTLKGDGTLGVVNVTGGVVSPGNSPGVLHVTTITFNSNSTLEEEIDGPAAGTQYDQLAATGAVNLGNATLHTDLLPTYIPNPGSVFTIITAGSVTGTFNGLPNGATVTLNGLTFRINYNATTVTLTYVPAPLVDTGTNVWLAALASAVIMAAAATTMFGSRKQYETSALK